MDLPDRLTNAIRNAPPAKEYDHWLDEAFVAYIDGDYFWCSKNGGASRRCDAILATIGF